MSATEKSFIEQSEEIGALASALRTDGGIWLPQGETEIRACACALFSEIAKAKALFSRGGAAQVVVKGTLEILKPQSARSYFEKYAEFWTWRKEEGKLKPKRTHLSADMASAILGCHEAQELLPKVHGLVGCPILYGEGEIIGPGYHEESGLYITGGISPPVMPLAEAVELLKSLVAEFEFKTQGDRSRAIAMFITPALRFGDYLMERIPADIGEADVSQSGKTYRQQISAAIYKHCPATLGQTKGGVGSVDESIASVLITGLPFIQLDNLRGRFDSQFVEAFLTARGTSFSVRSPYRGSLMVDPTRFFIQISSNGLETTVDLANRACIVRIVKKENFAFKQYPEGALLEHVEANQPLYLGAVFAVVKEWLAQGRLRTGETGHDFRAWAQTLDWIVQEIFNEAPLIEGHREAQKRASSPDLNFLRSLAIEVIRLERNGEWLPARDLYEICDAADISVPGLKEKSDDGGKKVVRAVLARAFRNENPLVVDGFSVERHESDGTREGGGAYVARSYVFEKSVPV